MRSIIRAIRRGVDAIARPDSADWDVDEELRHYLDESTHAHEARGLSHDAAVRAAMLEMGRLTSTRERVRSAGWEHAVETMLSDVHYALRRLRRSPAFSATAIITLALGVGASTAVFSAISPILLEPLPFPHANRIVVIDDRTADGAPMPVTLGTYAEVRTRSRSFDQVAVADAWQPSITGDGDPERLKGQRVTADYFGVYGVTPAVGRAFSVDEQQPNGARVAIISDGFLLRRFAGDRAILGKTIDLDGDPYMIVGIMPAGFDNVIAPSTEIWTPLRDVVTSDFSSRAWGHHYAMIGRLSPTASVEGASRELATIGKAPLPAFARPAWANLSAGLMVRTMQAGVTGPVRPSLYAIIGAVGLLLLIACVNVTNLLLGRGAQRRAELAMRTALGAGRGRIVRQLITETIVLALVSSTLGLVFAQLGVRGLVAVSPPGLPRVDAIRLDLRVFLFALALTMVVGAIVGVFPSLAAIRSDADGGAGLHQMAQSRVNVRARTRNALVVVEVALAVVLLVSAGLLYRSVTRLLRVQPGFDPSNLITMQVIAAGREFGDDTARLQLFTQTLDAVRRVPGVVSASFTSQLPLSGDIDGYGVEAQSIPDARGGALGSALRYAVTPEYFAAMRIPLLQGRLVDDRDRPGGPEAVVINQSMAKRLYGNRNPIGERMRFGPEVGGNREWDYVIGVVGDVKHYSLAADAPDAFYVASGQWDWVDNVQTLVVKTSGAADALAPSLKRAVWSVNRNVPIQRVRTMDAFVAASAGQRRFALLVVNVFAVVAFVLAAIGLYGVIAGGVIERLREIGIRAALGATPSSIVQAVIRRSLTLAALGALLGVMASVAATQLIRTMLFGVTTTDALTYGGVSALLLLTAFIAAWAPARRAAGVDPTTVLRAE